MNKLWVKYTNLFEFKDSENVTCVWNKVIAKKGSFMLGKGLEIFNVLMFLNQV